MEYEYTPRDEIQHRIARFQALLQDNDIAGALVSQNADLFYFSGTIQPASLFIPAQGEPLLAVYENLERASKESALKQIAPAKNSRQLPELLSSFNYSVQGRIGLEMDVLPAKYYLAQCRDFPRANFIDCSELIRKMRMIKSEYEIKQIKRACEILNLVMRAAKACSLLYKEVMEMVSERGYQDYFMGYKGHQVAFLGHGIGLEIDEYPLITADFPEVFQENMVFAFEPKLVFPDIGAVGVEDDYLVTKTGVKRLTTYDDGILTVEQEQSSREFRQ